jgi:hypothetical protein
MIEETKTTEPVEPYLAALIGNAYVVRWQRAPSVMEVNELLREIIAAASSHGKTLVCIAIVPGSVNPPEDEARRQMMANTEKILAVAQAMHFVIEGSGFKHVMLRSVVTGLILVSGRRGKIVVHNSFDEAARAAGPTLSMPVTSLVSLARAKGFVSPPE